MRSLQQHTKFWLWILLVVSASVIRGQEGSDASKIVLNDGNPMPQVGLGVALTADKTYEAVSHALDLGYRLIDTAAEESYGNEDQVGKAVSDYYQQNHLSEKVFITTKLWDADHGFGNTIRAFWRSYRELNKFVATNTTTKSSNIPIDLYLVHSPYGGRLVETWDALLWLQKHHSDKVTSIGVSNFGIEHLEVLRVAGRPMPVVNQIEMHPLVYQQRRDLLDYCHKHHIQIQAFGSLMHGYPHFLDDPPPVLRAITERYNPDGKERYRVHNKDNEKTAATVTVVHVLLQWALQHDFAIIPKSSKPKRITENVRYIPLKPATATSPADFVLSESDMKLLDEWGDHVPYEDRNIYKTDWNWNPIDEAPIHRGNTQYWPDYKGIGLEEQYDLDRLIQKLPMYSLDENEYWDEYWENGEHLEYHSGGDDDDDHMYRSEYDDDDENHHGYDEEDWRNGEIDYVEEDEDLNEEL